MVVRGRLVEDASLAEPTKGHTAGHWSRPWEQGCAEEQGHTQRHTVSLKACSFTFPSGKLGELRSWDGGKSCLPRLGKPGAFLALCGCPGKALTHGLGTSCLRLSKTEM